jgi:hypothetical protein
MGDRLGTLRAVDIIFFVIFKINLKFLTVFKFIVPFRTQKTVFSSPSHFYISKQSVEIPLKLS